MLKKLLLAVIELVAHGKRAVLYRLLFLLLFVLPGLALVLFSYSRFYGETTASMLTQKEMLAHLAASSVYDRLNAVMELGISLATRPLVMDAVGRGDWQAAIGVLSSVPATFPYIDRIVLYDPGAVIRADVPSDPDVIGQSRTDKPWYAGIKHDWQPHISPVYGRGATPKMNLVSAAFPIRKRTAAPGLPAAAPGPVIGILQLQLKLELFQQWVRRAGLDAGAVVYIVDQRGRIVAHPQIDNLEVNIDFSGVPAVQKLLRGESGAEFSYNPVEKQERFAAYEPVEKYGWGVVVAQPASQAFSERGTALRTLQIIYLLFIGLTAITAFFIVYAMIVNKRSQEAAQRLAAIVTSSADAIIGKDYDGTITSWNAGAERMYGYTSREAVGRPIFMLAPGHMTEEEIRGFLRRLRSGEKIENFETVRRKKDGTLINVSLTISPVVNELGRLEGSSTIARDITSRKQAEQEREELLASLQDALASVKTLRGMLPICASCKKIRNDEGYWERIETYIREHSDASFTHGLCPDCAKKLYPQYYGDGQPMPGPKPTPKPDADAETKSKS